MDISPTGIATVVLWFLVILFVVVPVCLPLWTAALYFFRGLSIMARDWCEGIEADSKARRKNPA